MSKALSLDLRVRVLSNVLRTITDSYALDGDSYDI